MNTNAHPVTPESGLVLEGTLMIPTRVGTRLQWEQTMETNTSRPWDTSWFSNKKLNFPYALDGDPS